MVQLIEQPEREKMFNENYAFFSGTSRYMSVTSPSSPTRSARRYFQDADPSSSRLQQRRHHAQELAAKGIRHLGDRAFGNVADAARANGIRTLCRFFDAETAAIVVAGERQQTRSWRQRHVHIRICTR